MQLMNGVLQQTNKHITPKCPLSVYQGPMTDFIETTPNERNLMSQEP